MPKRKGPVSIEDSGKYLNELEEVSDVVTLILKGHLLVEEALYTAIQTRISHPHYLLEANLRFAQLVMVGKALFFKQEHAQVWDAIHNLNALRNRLAHTLEMSVVKEDIRKINFLMNVPEDVSPDHPEARQWIGWGIASMLGYLSMLRKGI